ncbi:MAG: hypothetical protein V4714_06285 [Bacteroidota bacterium]
MGYLEAVVVIYLRALYYPGGFQFPLVPMDHSLAAIEFWREAATLVMLAGVGFLFGRTRTQRLAGFLYSFAIWDLCYYLFLKIALDWPESVFTWDILFLIPVPWVGPVLAPCILSVTMIALAAVLYNQATTRVDSSIRRAESWLLTFGSLVVIASFIWGYVRYVLRHNASLWNLSSQSDLFAEAMTYVPRHFNWPLFIAGELLLAWAVYRIACYKSRKPVISPKTTSARRTESESFADYLNAL